MTITDDGALIPLRVVYVTTTSAVLVCEVADELKDQINYWEVYLNDEFYSVATNEGTNVDITHLYYRLLNLERETTYTVAVKAVTLSEEKSNLSNEEVFETFPKF